MTMVESWSYLGMTAVGMVWTPGDKLTLPAGRSLRSLPRQGGQPVAGKAINHFVNRIIGSQEEIFRHASSQNINPRGER